MQEIEWQFDAVDLRPVVRWLEARQPARDAAPEIEISPVGDARQPGSGGTPPVPDRQPSPDGGGSAHVPMHALDGPHSTGQPSVAFSPLERRQLTDTYLDSTQWRFHRAGLALRLRNTNGRHECSLKTLEAPVDGLRTRTEIQAPLPSGDVQALLEVDARAGEWIRSLAGNQPLVALFTLRSTRRPFAILLDGRAVGEVVLDEIWVNQTLEGGPPRLRRVEVEVQPAVVSRLRPFVDDLRVACKLTPAVASKFEVGLLTADIAPAGMPEVGDVSVADRPTMGELAYAVVRRSFLAFLRNEPGTRVGEDIEALHDMRVATRRMRAALALFEPAFPLRARSLQEGLRWVAGVLGEVRDLDIQLSWITSWSQAAAPADQASLQLLVSELERRRLRARKKMLRALDSQRFSRFVTRFTRVLIGGPPRRSPASRAPALAAFPGLIERRFAQATKAGKNLRADSPPEGFHRLRIRCKRLRYAVENARDLYGVQADKYIAVLVRLQDILGLHQDAFVAMDRLQQLLESGAHRLPPRVVFMMGRVAQRYEQQAGKLRKRFGEAYQGLQGKAWARLQRAMRKGQSLEGVLSWPPEPKPDLDAPNQPQVV